MLKYAVTLSGLAVLMTVQYIDVSGLVGRTPPKDNAFGLLLLTFVYSPNRRTT